MFHDTLELHESRTEITKKHTKDKKPITHKHGLVFQLKRYDIRDIWSLVVEVDSKVTQCKNASPKLQKHNSFSLNRTEI